MVPLAVAGRADGARGAGPVMIMRYNMYPAAAINGNPAAASVPARRSS